jgi:integrase
MKLTAKAVAALELPAGKTDVIHFDSELPGFGYRLRRGAGAAVRKSWIAQYRRAGATRRLLLGSAAVLSPERARAAAKEALAAVALGRDPQGDRRDRRGKDRLTVRGLVAEYLAAKASQKKRPPRPRTMVETRRYLSDPRYFGPLLGMPVDAVNRRDVVARLVVISRSGGAIAAARARAALSTFFTWSMQSGVVESNPVIGTAKPAEDEPRARTLSDPELAAIWHSCRDDAFGTVIKLLALTGCRRSEIGGMAWSELDLEQGLFTIPATRSKNGRAHTLPLAPLALDLVKSVPHVAGRELLFGSRSAAGFSRWTQGRVRLERDSGVAGWVIHDLRRTAATRMADLGVQPHIIEQILNHVSGHKSGVAGVYNRSSYDREVRTALAMWADRVRALVEDGGRKIVLLSSAAGC